MRYIRLPNQLINEPKYSVLLSLANFGIKIPNFFVIKEEAFKEFLEKNQIKNTINSLLEQNKEYEDILSTLLLEEFPDEIKDELEEIYFTIAKKEKEEIEFLKKMSIYPEKFLIIRSDKDKTIEKRVKTFNELQDGIKEVWARIVSLYKTLNVGDIVVMEDIEFEKVGIVSNINIFTGAKEIILQAIYGTYFQKMLEESPDTIVLGDNGEILFKILGKKEKACILDPFTNKYLIINIPEEKKVKDALSLEDIKKLHEFAINFTNANDKPFIMIFGIREGKIYVIDFRTLKSDFSNYPRDRNMLRLTNKDIEGNVGTDIGTNLNDLDKYNALLIDIPIFLISPKALEIMTKDKSVFIVNDLEKYLGKNIQITKDKILIKGVEKEEIKEELPTETKEVIQQQEVEEKREETVIKEEVKREEKPTILPLSGIIWPTSYEILTFSNKLFDGIVKEYEDHFEEINTRKVIRKIKSLEDILSAREGDCFTIDISGIDADKLDKILKLVDKNHVYVYIRDKTDPFKIKICINSGITRYIVRDELLPEITFILYRYEKKK